MWRPSPLRPPCRRRCIGPDAFADVGKQPPITILITSSPWYPAFEKVVELYEQQTGNQIKLDMTPFGGMLEKARNAVRGRRAPTTSCSSTRSGRSSSTRAAS